jgi:hypothetical protein
MATKMDCLEHVTLQANVADVTWTSIDQSYTDLQIICSYQDDSTNSYADWKMQFNGDTDTDYCYTENKTYWGNNWNDDKKASQAKFEPGWARGGAQPSPDTPFAFGTSVIWIYDYTSAAKGKTISVWSYVPFAYTNYQEVQFVSGAFTDSSTDALTSIKLWRYATDDWTRGSTFSLYGVG